MVEEGKIVANSILSAIHNEHIANVYLLSNSGAELSSGTGNILTGHYLEKILTEHHPQSQYHQ